MGPVTADLGLAMPAQICEPEAKLRRARVHLDGAGPLVAPTAARTVTQLAGELGLGGFVRTDPHGVTVEVEGRAGPVADFLRRIAAGELGAGWGPGGELAPLGAGEFAVLAVSARRTAAAAHRGTDVALCVTCVSALFDRDHPRFLDPAIGCPGCRPDLTGSARSRLRLVDDAGRPIEGNPLKSAMALLLVGGRIVATGDALRTRFFVDATRPAAVASLAALARPGETRMVALCPDVEWARRLAVVDEAEAGALVSRRNPVLLLEPLPVGPARELTPPDSRLAVTLPGCGLTHLMARAAARPLAYLDLPTPAGSGHAAFAPAIGMLFAEPDI